MDYITVGIGEVLWDMLPIGQKIGGAPVNFAYHASQFDLDSNVVSAIGNDSLGDEMIEVFEQKEIKYCFQRVDYPTGIVQIALDSGGVPAYKIKGNVAWDNIPFTNELKQLAQRTSVVCFGSLAQRHAMSRNTICQFLDSMPDTDNVLKIFDINLRQNFYNKEILHDSLVRCNVLKINEEEAKVVGCLFDLPVTEPQEQCRILLEQYRLQIVILTCGIDGSYIFTSKVSSFQKTPSVKVADTVGAGDSFLAAFCAALLYGKSISEAHKLAVEVSAYVCSQHGSMPILSSELKHKVIY